MASEDQKSSADVDEQYQHTPGVSSPAAAVSQQGTPLGSERIEEPIYQEHRGNSSGQQPVAGPSFYPADLPDQQLQEERWRADRHKGWGQAPPLHPLQAQPQQKNSPYLYSQGQQAYGAVPPVPVPLPRQGPIPSTPNPQYPPYPPNTPYGQQYRGTPPPYTDPQAYQHPSNGYVQQPQPLVHPGYPQQGPGYPYQGYYAPYGYQQRSYPGYPGYPPGYPAYPYVWYPPHPRRNGYQLTMAIISLIASILVIIGGVFCGIALLGLTLAPTTTSNIEPSQLFGSAMLFAALMIAGVVGGGFGVFHSAFALAARPSRPFKLPPFWSFLPIYVVLLIVGLTVGTSDYVINNLPLAFLLIALCGILPALTFLALALRRLRQPETHTWPTTWRRLTLALVSGATSAIVLALIFEFIFTAIAKRQFSIANTSPLDNPNVPIPHDPASLIFYLLILSAIAPIVEESFKPLAVITMIGRIRSAAEAFILGMACGIGFDMMETTGYIGLGYQHWIAVAIDRSTAGLLHGLGAGMMALGWYYLTHKDALKHDRISIALGCMLYALLQHAIWNGSLLLMFLPDPIGPYLENGKITILNYQFDSFLIVYIIFSVLMLRFLWFVTGKIRLQPGKQTTSL